MLAIIIKYQGNWLFLFQNRPIMKNKNLNHFWMLAALLLFAFYANSQKLPDVQLQSLRAPANVKIDGNPTEWGTLQAYNHATEVFYSIANNDENLYLIVQATDGDIINRIVGKGITFTIQKSGEKKGNGGKGITYPVVAAKNGITFNLRNGIILDTTPKIADSLMRINNELLNRVHRWINVIGMSGLVSEIRADSILSVDNPDNIKAAEAFNNRRVYTFEVSIPLKHLHLSKNEAPKFDYLIIVNGLTGFKMTVKAPQNQTPEQIAFTQRMQTYASTQTSRMSLPTDFWGEYILVKN